MTKYTPEQLIEILKTTCTVDSDGTKYWYLNGKSHRVDGPAVEWADGTKLWFLNDKQYTEEEFNKQVK